VIWDLKKSQLLGKWHEEEAVENGWLVLHNARSPSARSIPDPLPALSFPNFSDIVSGYDQMSVFNDLSS